jgi:hypothetical protein
MNEMGANQSPLLTRMAGGRPVERQQAAELDPHAGHVGGDGGGAQQVTLGALARRVADHAGGAADDGDRAVPGQLQPALDGERHQVADVQRAGGRVVPGVVGDVAGGQGRAQLVGVGHVGDQAARLQLGEDVGGDRGGHDQVPSRYRAYSDARVSRSTTTRT